MILILTVLLFSVVVNSFLYVPFINLLYKLKFQRQLQKTKDAFEKPTPIFDMLHQGKVGTPVGGGGLVIVTTALFFPVILLLMRYFFVPLTSIYPFSREVIVVLFTFLTYGGLGLIDDLKKTFAWAKGSFFGLRLRHKLLIQVLLALIISLWLYGEMHIHILHVPLIGVVDLGILYVPFAAMVIIAFSNAFNITDGLDGLAGGVLMITLVAFLVMSAAILDAPLSVFIALWLGGLIAFLYFNVYPARIWLGDVGALSFGATFAVVGLLLGKTLALVVIGGVFVAEVGSSLLQLLSKKFRGKKLMPVAPLHLWLQYRGWPEPKIVMRFWLISIMLSALGLWFALITRN